MSALSSKYSPVGIDVMRFRWFLEAPDAATTYGGEVRRLLPYAAAYALLHGLLVALGFELNLVPEGAVSIWPAVGLLCGILASTPARNWPIWIAASLVGRTVFELIVIEDRGLLAPLLFGAVNAIEAIVLAAFMQKPLVQAYRQGRPLYLSVALAIGAAGAAGIGGLLGAAMVQLLGFEPSDFWQALRLWSAGDYVGIVLVAPIAVWFMLPQLRIRRHLARLPERAAMPLILFGLLALSAWLVPGEEFVYRDAALVGLAAMLTLPLLWAAIRADFPMVAFLELLLAVSVIVVSKYGYGPFAHDADDYLPALAKMQIFLIVTILVVTIVAFAVLERQRAQTESDLHQRFTDLLVLLTNKLMAAGPDRLDDIISESLQLIAGFARADRCVLLQIGDDGKSILRTHTWSADGVSKHPPELVQADLRDYPWVIGQFRTRGFVVLDDLDRGLPEGAEELESIVRAVPDTVSAIYVGLFTDDKIIGAIGLGYVRRGVRWTSETVSLMYLVGQLFANILTRKKTERELDAYQKKLRSLATDLAVTEERTRRRAAIDLHDGIGQNLAVARMKLGLLLARAGEQKQDLVQVRNLIDEALRGTRFIIADLSPTILYELGLVPALQSLAERFEPANDLSCSICESGAAWQPGTDMSIALYRAVQECLNNVARHAKAQNVDIDVRWKPDRLDIDVRDDGVGFDAAVDVSELPDVSGFGLFSMRESLSLHGGSLDIETARGIGTSIRLSVPRPGGEDEE